MDSAAIDAAVVAKLSGDAMLAGLMPDGVWFDVAASANATRFVIVSVALATDEPVMDTRAYEEVLYLVKAVERGTSGLAAKQAAARIDELLERQPLTITGYAHMQTQRVERLRFTEVDPVDRDARWHHRGGRYTVWASPEAEASPQVET